MDSKGHIYDSEMMARLDEKQREKLTPIPNELESMLRSMNRRQRRAWLAVNRRKQARS